MHANSMPARLYALEVGQSAYFELGPLSADEVQRRVQSALSKWRRIAELKHRVFYKSTVIVVETDALAAYKLVRVTRIPDRSF